MSVKVGDHHPDYGFVQISAVQAGDTVPRAAVKGTFGYVRSKAEHPGVLFETEEGYFFVSASRLKSVMRKAGL